MHAESSIRLSRKLTFIFLALVLAGCGKGDGPKSIAGTAATPLPELPAGFCDAINFETLCPDPAIINFNGGATIVVENNVDVVVPDPTGVNPPAGSPSDSDKFARMQKFPDEVFGGTKLVLPAPIDFSLGEVYKIKVWSSRPVPVTFKLEEEGNPDFGGLAKVADHGGGGAWEELCFDFTGQAVPPPVISLTIIFDNGTQGAAATNPPDWTFYYDDITQVESCVDTGPATGVIPDVKLYDPAGNPDLVIPDDYAEVTPFGSQSVINPLYADDASYSPVLAVSSGVGYGANIGQIGYIGFAAGFASAYETLDFKVKGMPNFVIFVKLFDGVDTLRINLSSSGSSVLLDDGWYQVSIPLSSFTGVGQATGIVFESDDTAPMQFTMLLTDIGFSETGGGPPQPPPFDDGLLTNGDFEAGVSPWLAGVDNPIGAENVIDDNGNNVYFVNVTAAGNAFDVNLSQKLTITPDETYTVAFKAKSDRARSILAGIGLSDGTFANVTQSVDLTTDWQTFTVELTAAGFGDANSRVLFDMGAEVGEVYIDDVSLVVSTGGGPPQPPPFDDGLLTNGDFEAGVSPWLAGVDNPIGAENVIDDNGNNVYFVNVTAAGNAFDVNLSQKLTITPDETYTVAFKAKSDRARSILAGIGLSDGTFANVTQSVDLTTDWQTFTVELTAAGFGDANSRVLFDMGAEVGEVYIDDVSLVVSTGGGGGTGGNIAINGGFETGAFNDGSPNASWQQFISPGGIQEIVTDNPSEGTYAANLVVPVRTQTDPAVDNLIKNANLQAGNLTPGASITVSFDMRGSLSGAGGVVFAELFSELSGGGTSKSEILSGGPLAPVTAWTNYSYTTTLGPDVSGGVTLQLKTSCGPVEGCGVDAYFDNVSITIN